MTTPSISVIVPAYNAADTILEALDSILRQTVLPSEVIVIDDVSSDNTADVVEGYIAEKQAAASPSIKLIQQEQNGGPAAARNAGIAASSGEWVAFLDGDDVWLPQRLEAQRQVAARHPDAALICSPTLPLDENHFADSGADQERAAQDCTAPPPGAAQDCVSQPKCSARLHLAARPKGGNAHSVLRTAGEVQPRATPLTLEDFIYENPVATSTVLIRRDALDATNGFDKAFRGPEDYDLWLRVVASFQAIKTTEPLSLYRHVQGSLSMDDRTFLPQVIAVLKKAFSKGGALEAYADCKRRAYAEKYSSASWMAFDRGARMAALRHLAKSYATYIRRIEPEERDPLLRIKLLLLYLGLRPRTKG